MPHVKLIFALILVTGLAGCATAGPMHTAAGPLQTPAFKPIILDTVNDGSENVRFKEWTTLYEGKELERWGVFFITDKGLYMANWDIREYRYNLVYKLAAEDIADISEDLVERSMWVDSNLLVIKDKNGHEVGFALNGRNAVRAIIREIIDASRKS